MTTIMPPIPRFFFYYIEPVLVSFGSLNPIFNPKSIVELLPLHLSGRRSLALAGYANKPTPLEHLLALQTSCMGLMFVVLTTGIMRYAKDPTVVHAYVWASLLTDFPWWASMAYVLGPQGMREWRTWETGLWMMWLVPAFTVMFKVGYLSGAFGPDRVAGKERKGQ